MHIAFVSTQFVASSLVGGLGNYLQRVGLSLVERGHRATIFMIAEESGIEVFRGIQLVRVAGKKAGVIHRLFSGYKHANAFQSRMLNDAIQHHHTGDPIDIIQYTNYRATALYRPPVIPAVLRVSSFRPLWDPYHPNEGQTRSRRIAAALEDRAFYNVDGVYSPSQVLADAISEQLKMEVSVIEPPFVMDTAELDTSIIDRIVGDIPFFLYVGHLTRRKGVLTIRDALPTILAEHPNHRFVFVGRTDVTGERITPDIIRDAAGDRSGQIIFTGPLRHPQLYPFYERAQAVILPSLIDNIANTALEAMAMGGIVVGTDGGSFEQLIIDSESGFLCKPGDEQSLVTAVRKAASIGGKMRDSFSTAARARISRLAPEITIPRLLEYYQRFV